MARHGTACPIYKRRFTKHACTTSRDINRRESLGACGTSVYKRPRVNALHYGNVIAAREKPRDADLFIYLYVAALHTGDNGSRREQWRVRDIARYVRPPRISQSTLRTREGFVGGVADAERCVLFAS